MSGHFEAKKHAYRQTQDGIVVSFVVHPNDLDAAFAIAPLGTRYMIGFSEIGDDDKPIAPSSSNGRTSDFGSENRGSSPREGTKDRRPFSSLPLSQQAGIRCNDPEFMAWLLQEFAPEVGVGPEELVRTVCFVSSRSELNLNKLAGAKWRKLEEDFQAYKTDLRYAGTARL